MTEAPPFLIHDADEQNEERPPPNLQRWLLQQDDGVSIVNKSNVARSQQTIK